MARPTHVDIASLRSEVNRILDLFEKHGVSSVECDADYYWSVPWGSEYLTRADVPAPEPDIGSLADDIEFLEKASGHAPVALMLCHAAPVLHYLGQRAGALGVY